MKMFRYSARINHFLNELHVKNSIVVHLSCLVLNETYSRKEGTYDIGFDVTGNDLFLNVWHH